MEFKTHTGLTLRWADKKVLLIGDREKLLYPVGEQKYDLNEAAKVFRQVKAQYEAAEKVS